MLVWWRLASASRLHLLQIPPLHCGNLLIQYLASNSNMVPVCRMCPSHSCTYIPHQLGTLRVTTTCWEGWHSRKGKRIGYLTTIPSSWSPVTAWLRENKNTFSDWISRHSPRSRCPWNEFSNFVSGSRWVSIWGHCLGSYWWSPKAHMPKEGISTFCYVLHQLGDTKVRGHPPTWYELFKDGTYHWCCNEARSQPRGRMLLIIALQA